MKVGKATANGYTTLKVFEKQAVAVPGPQKKRNEHPVPGYKLLVMLFQIHLLFMF